MTREKYVEIDLIEINSIKDIEKAEDKLASLASDKNARIKTNLQLMIHRNINYMALKIGENRYKNVFTYSYESNEISSLDGLVGVLLDKYHVVKMHPDIEIVQKLYPVNMVLVYLASLKELFLKRNL